MKSNFGDSIDRVLKSEGMYVNDPNDPGGETNWGLSKRSYPNLNIKLLTRDGAVLIYKSDFWDHVHADDLPFTLQFQVLDFAVNCGIGTAIRKLQVAAGVADDGWWGPVTVAAAKNMPEAALVCRFIAEELDYRRKLSTFPRYGNGWTARVAEDLRYAAADIIKGPSK